MAPFHFGKKTEDLKAPTCCGDSVHKVGESNRLCGAEAAKEPISASDAAAGGRVCIKVLGAGCRSCRELYENVKAAVREMGLNAEVEYITEMERVMDYGAMSMPAIAVNEKVVSMGRVLKSADVQKLLKKIGIA